MIGAQGFLLGLIGGSLGCISAIVLGEAIQWSLSHLVSDFPFKPSHWFIWSWSSTLFTAVLGTVLTVMAGIIPLRKLTDENSMLEDLH
jgi:ABC-type antimicrobial peptide transport system permease subunit